MSWTTWMTLALIGLAAVAMLVWLVGPFAQLSRRLRPHPMSELSPHREGTPIASDELVSRTRR